MNAFQLTLKSAAHTLSAVYRKGAKDIRVTYELITDPEMIAIYRAVYQALYGLSMLCYGLGVLSARAVDRWVQSCMCAEDPVEDYSAAVSHDADDSAAVSHDAEDSIEELKSIVKEDLVSFFSSLSTKNMHKHLKDLGLPYRDRNRRYNKTECTGVYAEYLAKV